MWLRTSFARRKATDEERAGGAAVDERARSERVVACESCEHSLARVDERIEVSGSHQHTCVNPAGYVFRIACFRRAPGCAGRGGFSEEHSWFAGHAWQIAVCGRCDLHLGWAFRGEEGGFHGLIATRIVERDAS
jgi:hypothetical protein